MPKSFDDFAATTDGVEPKSGTNEEFFGEHPHLVDEIVKAKEDGYSWQNIFDWLKAEYKYGPKHPTAIRKHLHSLGLQP